MRLAQVGMSLLHPQLSVELGYLRCRPVTSFVQARALQRLAGVLGATVTWISECGFRGGNGIHLREDAIHLRMQTPA